MPDPVKYLSLDDLLTIATTATGSEPMVRDFGLLQAAADRPQTTVFGNDAYPSIHTKAAAMLQSIARNHALVDGNKRTAWLATYVFYDLNGYELDAPNDDDPVALMLDVVTEHLEVDEIAGRLTPWAKPR
jgi:death on curing protein